MSASNNSQLLSTANKSNNQLNYTMATTKLKPNDKIVMNLTSSPGQRKQSTTKSINQAVIQNCKFSNIILQMSQFN